MVAVSRQSAENTSLQHHPIEQRNFIENVNLLFSIAQALTNYGGLAQYQLDHCDSYRDQRSDRSRGRPEPDSGDAVMHASKQHVDAQG